MSAPRLPVQVPGEFVPNINSLGEMTIETYPNPSCHAIPVVFDENGTPLVELGVTFRGSIKVTKGGALDPTNSEKTMFEPIKVGGLREIDEEARRLGITEAMLSNFGWSYLKTDKKTGKLEYATFCVAAFNTTDVFTPAKQAEVSAQHKAEDVAAKKLLSLFDTNNLNGLETELNRLKQANEEQKEDVLPLHYLNACLDKLQAHKADPNNTAKKDALGEEIRVKTEFNQRQFVKLADLMPVCETQLRIEAAKDAAKDSAAVKALKTPLDILKAKLKEVKADANAEAALKQQINEAEKAVDAEVLRQVTAAFTTELQSQSLGEAQVSAQLAYLNLPNGPTVMTGVGKDKKTGQPIAVNYALFGPNVKTIYGLLVHPVFNLALTEAQRVVRIKNASPSQFGGTFSHAATSAAAPAPAAADLTRAHRA